LHKCRRAIAPTNHVSTPCRVSADIRNHFAHLPILVHQNWIRSASHNFLTIAVFRSSHPDFIRRSYNFSINWLFRAILAVCDQLRSQRRTNSDHHWIELWQLRRNCSNWQHASHECQARLFIAQHAADLHDTEWLSAAVERPGAATARRHQFAWWHAQFRTVSTRLEGPS